MLLRMTTTCNQAIPSVKGTHLAKLKFDLPHTICQRAAAGSDSRKQYQRGGGSIVSGKLADLGAQRDVETKSVARFSDADNPTSYLQSPKTEWAQGDPRGGE